MEIKHLILDLGGVLYDLNYKKTQQAFLDLGLDAVFSKKTQTEVFDAFEEGKLSPDEFLNLLSSASSAEKKPTHEQLTLAWNAMLLGLPEYQLEVLEELKKRYDLFLFSNTNQIHISAVWEHIENRHGIPNLDSYFQKVYLSNELGIRKPKPEGFKHIVSENQLNPKKTLFIDDSPQHVEGAKKAGINALWLDLDTQDLSSLLKTHKIL